MKTIRSRLKRISRPVKACLLVFLTGFSASRQNLQVSQKNLWSYQTDLQCSQTDLRAMRFPDIKPNKMESKLFTLDWIDIINGLIIAFLAALLDEIIKILDSGAVFEWESLVKS
ncbi:MAG: hypothetical protein Q7T72_11760 [Bacteroidales bacterium]|nr:hypothetical protein [Bacteroidales bacterium]